MSLLAVVGTGTWGTATAALLATTQPNTRVLLWGRRADQVAELAASRLHPRLGEHRLPAAVEPITDGAALTAAEAVFWAVPTQHSHAQLSVLRPYLQPQRPLISLAKGIEEEHLLRVTELFEHVLGPGCYGCLSGPSHAEEVIAGQPCALVAAGPADLQRVTTDSLHSPRLRIYTSEDLIGVELAGALKNVIAIAAGIADGIAIGDNAKAALVTRGVAEIRRLGRAMGAKDATFAGLAGIGDLLTTCYSPHGRNRALGLAVAGGATAHEHIAASGMVAEGAYTCRAAMRLGERHGVELPIASQVASMVWGGKPVREAISALLERAAKEENA